MSTLSDRTFPNGTFISGKWHRRRYRVERLLGVGANGQVYLVRRNQSLYALKAGYEALDHQSEVNVLKSLMKASPEFRHYMIDADDFVWNGQNIPFYVMKYVKGRSLPEFIRLKGVEWLPVIGLNLMRKLRALHRLGWVFGDLKPENVIVTDFGGVELVDFGGVTPMGRSVKQFTELYDRGFWKAGTRVADEAYDLFSFAVLYILSAKENGSPAVMANLLPQNRGIDVLLDEMSTIPAIQPVSAVLKKALAGQYRSSEEALRDWRKATPSVAEPKQATSGTPGRGLKIWFASSLLLFAASLYFFWLKGG
mgnify:FL=1